jgi:membrane-anchored protein YejM (alkaline phosphatase superfamily)
VKSSSNSTSVVNQYFALSYFLVLVTTSLFLRQVNFVNFATIIFAAAAVLSYAFIYILPIYILIGLMQKCDDISFAAAFFKKIRVKSSWFIYTIAVILVSVLQLLLVTDSFIYKIFNFHFNGFVWNLITTKGGIESMGSTTSTIVTFIALVLGLLFIQTILLVLLLYVNRFKNICGLIFTKRKVTSVVILLIIMFISQIFAYGVSVLNNYRPVLSASEAFPFYIPVSFDSIAKKLGFVPKKEPSFNIKLGDTNLKYPLNPIQRQADHKKYNIVFLAAESLRADMLDKEIMPNATALAQNAINFKQHYSSGNGTRMGLYGMFYGLYGNYWFKCLNERRGPVLFDILKEDNYQMIMFSGAKFSYPEFDRTIFAGLPGNYLHDSKELNAKYSWEFDRLNVSKFINFMDKRDTNKPFMTFMFFESAHSPYNFPPENAIRKPYLEEFNYASDNLKKDMPLIKNRYINSCNHLDSQLGRILDYLEKNSLMESTIIIITGDHGQEFMEKGKWGHNSDFSEEQTRVPLVLWVPGLKSAEITTMTSHLDIPPTLLKLLGVTNPPEDYCFGFDLLGEIQRKYTIISDWDSLTYIDKDYKAILPLGAIGKQNVTTKNDEEVTDKSSFYNTNKLQLVEIMKQTSRFSK